MRRNHRNVKNIRIVMPGHDKFCCVCQDQVFQNWYDAGGNLNNNKIGSREEETMQARRKRRVFSKEFKEELVKLYNSGKPRKEIIEEYELTPSAFDKWVQQFGRAEPNQNNKKSMATDKELEQLKKEIEVLKNENKVLKEAVMIFARRT